MSYRELYLRDMILSIKCPQKRINNKKKQMTEISLDVDRIFRAS